MNFPQIARCAHVREVAPHPSGRGELNCTYARNPITDSHFFAPAHSIHFIARIEHRHGAETDPVRRARRSEGKRSKMTCARGTDFLASASGQHGTSRKAPSMPNACERQLLQSRCELCLQTRLESPHSRPTAREETRSRDSNYKKNRHCRSRTNGLMVRAVRRRPISPAHAGYRKRFARRIIRSRPRAAPDPRRNSSSLIPLSCSGSSPARYSRLPEDS